MFDELDAPGLAAAVSTLVYRSRRDDQGEPRIPGGPHSRLGVALDATVRAWSELDDLETAHKVETIQPLDTGLVEAVHRWAAGRSLDAVLKGSELSAGDFVRWCKQVIDVLDQIVAGGPARARAGHRAARPSTPCGTAWWRTRRSRRGCARVERSDLPYRVPV